ncbi:hypothetical protein PIB30_109963, partial [Stylosanthes scabra]|nr:hypothetical protein [Stylosanthes scabra]
MGNQQRQPFHNPNSNTYNLRWRNHPNFGWGGDQNLRNNNFQTRPPFQPQQRLPYQQPPPFSQQNNLHQPPKPQPTSFEAALEKLTLTTTTFVQSTNSPKTFSFLYKRATPASEPDQVVSLYEWISFPRR